MRKWVASVFAVTATLLLPMAIHTPMAVQPLSAMAVVESGSARVIVKYRVDSSLMKKQAMTAAGKRTLQAQTLGDRVGIALTAGRGVTERSHVVFANGLSSAQLASRLSADADVEYAVADERKHIVAAPNDPFYATRALGASSGGPVVGQWYLKPPGAAGTAANTAPSAINAEQAWDVTTGNASIVVAVLDTGLFFGHSELQGGNVLPGYDMVSADSDGSFTSANDGNGRDADATDPGDFVTSAEAANRSGPLYGCQVENSSWHGTQTLGLIGATTDNSAGIASVGRNVKVMPVRVIGKCGGFDSDIVTGMLWASGAYSASELSTLGLPANPTPAKVLNLSLGGSQTCSSLYSDAISRVNAMGAVIVAAAGNEGLGVDSPGNCAGAIAVAGLRSDGDKNGFSSLGPEVAISAPGGNCGTGTGCAYPIMTLLNGGTTTPNTVSTYSDAFNYSLGTSFSTPMVAGTIALMLSVQPTLTPAEIKAKLQSTARTFPTSGSTASTAACTAPTTTAQSYCYCTTSTCGAGMLDAHAAVLAAIGVQPRITVDTSAPTATQNVSLSSSSVVGTGVTLAGYQWAITSAGTTGAAIVGAANGSSIIVLPSAAGTFTVSLTTTDNTGAMATATGSVVVAAAPVVVVTPPTGTTTTTTTTTTSSSGGGAIDASGLLLLLAAVLSLVAIDRVERRRAAARARASNATPRKR